MFVHLQCVFHGIRFKVNKIGCREAINFFYVPAFILVRCGVVSNAFRIFPQAIRVFQVAAHSRRRARVLL